MFIACAAINKGTLERNVAVLIKTSSNSEITSMH